MGKFLTSIFLCPVLSYQVLYVKHRIAARSVRRNSIYEKNNSAMSLLSSMIRHVFNESSHEIEMTKSRFVSGTTFQNTYKSDLLIRNSLVELIRRLIFLYCHK